jgi:hypothetical protein
MLPPPGLFVDVVGIPRYDGSPCTTWEDLLASYEAYALRQGHGVVKVEDETTEAATVRP